MPVLPERTALVTGATRGIGLAAALSLARRGVRPILVGRDPGRLAQAVAAVREVAAAEPAAYLCDMSSMAAVRHLADHVRQDHARIDILINNAGGIHRKRTLTVDGVEATFATNHLSHFLLTTRLLDRLVAGAPARVITVASVAHTHGTMGFEDLGFARGYGIARAYNRSKLANVLFANELARRLAGTGVTSNSVHPGSVATNIWSNVPIWAKPLIWMFLRPTFLRVEQGADPVVRLADSPELEGVTGRYFDRHQDAPPSPVAQDAGVAARLWEVSERLAAGSS